MLTLRMKGINCMHIDDYTIVTISYSCNKMIILYVIKLDLDST